MKKLLTLTLFLFATLLLHAQIQEIATGAGYQKQSFVNLSNGTETQVANTAWDIAFTVFGFQDAGIFINESAGSSMGTPLPQVELYDALTSNFNDQPDPSTLTDFRLYNNEKSWNYGAFNEGREATNPFDYGWGLYNPATNQVQGSRVYVLKLRSGQYRKLLVESLTGTTYTFKYANLDGSNATTKTVNKADYPGKTLAYFNLDTGNAANLEPAAGFDFVFCRYTTTLYDPGTMTDITYILTGILHGRGAQAAKADGINPATVAYATYKDSLQSKLDVIGHDWKAFSGSVWSVDQDRVYFLKTKENRVWKLQFIDFEGSSTGKAVLEKTDLGIISAVDAPAALGMSVLAYPNPTTDRLYIALEAPAALQSEGLLTSFDAQGRVVAQQSVTLREGFQVQELPTANWPSGTYHLTLDLPNQRIALGKVVK